MTAFHSLFAFSTRFFISNLFLVLFIGVLFAVKRLFKNALPGRISYNLWFLLLILLAFPFLPFSSDGIFSDLLLLFSSMGSAPAVTNGDISGGSVFHGASPFHTIQDFTVSVSSHTSSVLGIFLFCLWGAGMLAMTCRLLCSLPKLCRIKASALPLTNENMLQIYTGCLREMHLRRFVPVYTTALLNTPATVGFFCPRIYVPEHLTADAGGKTLRYIFLHELQHYRHRDILTGHFLNLAEILYWFNPVVRYALGEMRQERELACDRSVLQMLSGKEYADYGTALLDFAEKMSLRSCPFSAEMSSDYSKLKRRILEIAGFRPTSPSDRRKGIVLYLCCAVFLLGLSPVLSTNAAASDKYVFPVEHKRVFRMDLTEEFGEYDGSFVLYDENAGTWSIYNEEKACTRVSPNSTYKIYAALLGLESDIITPEQSDLAWDGTPYPFDAWEANQNLRSAMQNSVNWYFQELDQTAGLPRIKTFLKRISYGNERTGVNPALYWTDFSLKISPVEQVELLRNFCHNTFHFSDENVQAVQNAILISSAPDCTLFGKTGTGRVDGKDINGWFIGYVEKAGNVYYFAVNVQGTGNATGAAAAEIAKAVLSERNLY